MNAISHTLTIRLQTALRGIISAVDGLGAHPSRHCPRAVLDAVDHARLVVQEVDLSPSVNHPGEGWRFLTEGEVIELGDEEWIEIWGRFTPIESWVGCTQCATSTPVRRRIITPTNEGGTDGTSVDIVAAAMLRGIGISPDHPLAAAMLRRGHEQILDPVAPPAKRRIYLRGGPLDGCWYMRAINLWEWREGKSLVFLLDDYEAWVCHTLIYSLPDADGICHFRP